MILVRLLLMLFVLVSIYSVVFHLLMMREDQEYTWFTGFYWTLTVMSTLGFGDITFHSDIGRLFSMVVLGTGMVFVLVLLPFTFIQFFYAPWMEAQHAASTPRKLKEDTKGHIVLTHWDSVTNNLVKKLPAYRYDYVLIVPTMEEAHRLSELGIKVVLGDLDDPETYRAVRLTQAAILAATGSDTSNTNAVFTAREIAPSLKIVATAERQASREVLHLSGVDQVIHLPELMGQSLARRCRAGSESANLIGKFHDLVLAEAPVGNTELDGKTLSESRLRQDIGISVVGVWERGNFLPAFADTRLSSNTVLVLAGSKSQLDLFNQRFSHSDQSAPIVIVGGGNVGKAAGKSLAKRGLKYKIIEQDSDLVEDPQNYIHGDAFHRTVLESAGILNAPAAILTTHDDDTNVYLAIYIRRIRPDIQLIGRVNLERNISTLHRAGADFVMSYASMGASMILNVLRSGRMLLITEGLGIFEVPLHGELEGKTIADSQIRADTGCSVVGLRRSDKTIANPQPETMFQAGDELIIIGNVEAEKSFLQRYPPPPPTSLESSNKFLNFG